MNNNNQPQTTEELEKIQEESEKQERPDQKQIISVPPRIRQKVNNLPDPTNPPLGYDNHGAFDKVFPYINIPALHPSNHGDTVIFNHPEAPANKLYLGDNLEVLRTLPTESIDLIYIDPPFFSGRNYNVIWGDSNEVRTFGDIWEGGITSYLIWLNARLWEMRRVLKKTGSIYVHCDWHASHYIKVEMDKIFGYNNFINEIVWSYEDVGGKSTPYYKRKHDIIFFYQKSNDRTTFNVQYCKLSDSTIKRFSPYLDQNGQLTYQKLKVTNPGVFRKLKGLPKDLNQAWLDINKGQPINDCWVEISAIKKGFNESIGYPTQKPKELLERIIKASSNEGDIVADFFCGGGTACAVAMKNKRKFIGCDSSSIAVSVSMDRLIKMGEEISGIKSNSNLTLNDEPTRTKLFGPESFQMKLQTENIVEGITEKVPNIEIYYFGVYPVDKFKNLSQEDFITFVLTSYGASRNTGEGLIHGYKPPAQQEPIYIGPSDSSRSIDTKDIKKFFDEVKQRVEPNKMIRAKIIAWRFSREAAAYLKILNKYIFDNNLPIELEAIPLDSKEFRKRILQRKPDIDEAELFLRFSKSPIIGDIKVKKVGELEYEFEAVDAISTNEDGWLVNCQWDFDYQEGHFCANKEYILSREKKKDKIRGEIFEAILAAKYKFQKPGEYTIACKIQDNLAGESILSKIINI